VLTRPQASPSDPTNSSMVVCGMMTDLGRVLVIRSATAGHGLSDFGGMPRSPSHVLALQIVVAAADSARKNSSNSLRLISTKELANSHTSAISVSLKLAQLVRLQREMARTAKGNCSIGEARGSSAGSH
jgi:hypothetical protein